MDQNLFPGKECGVVLQSHLGALADAVAAPVVAVAELVG